MTAASPPTHWRTRWSKNESRDERIWQMREAGMTYEQIATLTGRVIKGSRVRHIYNRVAGAKRRIAAGISPEALEAKTRERK